MPIYVLNANLVLFYAESTCSPSCPPFLRRRLSHPHQSPDDTGSKTQGRNGILSF